MAKYFTKNVYTLLTGALTAVILAASVGCYNLIPRKDSTRYFVLTAEDAVGVNTQTTEGVTLGIMPIDVAAHLDTPRMVLRWGDNEVFYSDYHRWGEGLSTGIASVLGQNLAASEGVKAVYVAPWSDVSSERDYDVYIEVLRFEGMKVKLVEEGKPPYNSQAVLEVVWEVRSRADSSLVKRDVFYKVKTLEGENTYSDLAAALSDSLSLLSAKILETVVPPEEQVQETVTDSEF